MDNKTTVEYKLIRSFIFRTDKTNINDKQIMWDEKYSKEHILEFATLNKYFDDVKFIYMMMEDYIYNIVIPFKKGHKLVIGASSNEESHTHYLTAYVYSTNYNEVMKESSNQKVKKR